MSEERVAESLVLAEFCAHLDYGAIPPDVTLRAHGALARAASAVDSAGEAPRESRGSFGATSLLRRAAVLGETIHPVMGRGGTAPGIIVVAVAVAQKSVSVESARVAEALVAGMETACRVSEALLALRGDLKWAAEHIAGRLGSATAVCRLASASPEIHLGAIGLASTQGAGLVVERVEASNAWLAGRAASDGLLAALLAMGEWRGPAAPLEGDRAMFRLLSGQQPPRSLVDQLGERWSMRSLPGPQSELPSLDFLLGNLARYPGEPVPGSPEGRQ